MSSPATAKNSAALVGATEGSGCGPNQPDQLIGAFMKTEDHRELFKGASS
jgi:hypothetical protein